eukprot:6196888-Pleurochrysis_carterae.AAC.2
MLRRPGRPSAAVGVVVGDFRALGGGPSLPVISERLFAGLRIRRRGCEEGTTGAPTIETGGAGTTGKQDCPPCVGPVPQGVGPQTTLELLAMLARLRVSRYLGTGGDGRLGIRDGVSTATGGCNGWFEPREATTRANGVVLGAAGLEWMCRVLKREVGERDERRGEPGCDQQRMYF